MSISISSRDLKYHIISPVQYILYFPSDRDEIKANNSTLITRNDFQAEYRTELNHRQLNSKGERVNGIKNNTTAYDIENHGRLFTTLSLTTVDKL